MSVLSPGNKFSEHLALQLVQLGDVAVAGVDDVYITTTRWSWGCSFQLRKKPNGRSLGRVVIVSDGQFIEAGNALKSGAATPFDGTVQDAIAHCKLFASLES